MRLGAAAPLVLLLTSTAATASASEWRWRQIYATPQIGGRLTALAVDPDDARRIFVGTEEGTVVRSTDGGRTWQELELSQSAAKDRAVGLSEPSLPPFGEDFPSLNFFVDPGDARYANRVPLVFTTTFWELGPDFTFYSFRLPEPELESDLLGDATASRREYTVPVRRIAFCPGNHFPLLVATTREVYGSPDDGWTFVRLFGLAGGAGVDHVTCARDDPSRVAVGTRTGLFVSYDGGLTFDQDLTGWPGQPATALAFAPAPPEARSRHPWLFIANEEELYAGDPRTADGLTSIYPDYDHADTAPWETITWIDTSPDGDIWLATESGVRFSSNGGKSWAVAARSLFERQKAEQVMLVPRPGQGPLAIVVLRDFVYQSEDGQTWEPLFHGASRRSFVQMAWAPGVGGGEPRLWLVTSGGVWATWIAPTERPRVDVEAQRWAKARLARTPDLGATIRGVVSATRVSAAQIDALASRASWSVWMPEVHVSAGTGPAPTLRLARSRPTPLDVETRTDRTDGYFYVDAHWELEQFFAYELRYDGQREQLHELRRTVGFVAEDAWHERVLLLRQLAEGRQDPLQIDALMTRVLALETILEVWLRHPLEDLR